MRRRGLDSGMDFRCLQSSMIKHSLMRVPASTNDATGLLHRTSSPSLRQGILEDPPHPSSMRWQLYEAIDIGTTPGCAIVRASLELMYRSCLKIHKPRRMNL